MRVVYQAENLQGAELFRQRLEQDGIPSVIRNAHLQGALGELPANLLPEVCVIDGTHYDRARAHVAEMEAAARAPLGPDRQCPHCGEDNPSNFELCWKCQEDL